MPIDLHLKYNKFSGSRTCISSGISGFMHFWSWSHQLNHIYVQFRGLWRVKVLQSQQTFCDTDVSVLCCSPQPLLRPPLLVTQTIQFQNVVEWVELGSELRARLQCKKHQKQTMRLYFISLVNLPHYILMTLRELCIMKEH